MVDVITALLPALLWLVPLLPLLAGGVITFLPDSCGKPAARLALAALFVACGISLSTLVCSVFRPDGEAIRLASSCQWFAFGKVAVRVGLLLDPISAAMSAMVAFVAFCIFLYSTSYMKGEARFGRFFGFLSLFCGAMLMLVLSNSLLLLFMAWELVGLSSYLLIGFYFEKPSAAAAAQKAFITTRIGDMAFFVGLIWLQSQAGTLLFYDHGNGLLEKTAVGSLAGTITIGGLAASSVVSLLLLIGAMGKSGQVPLHTWLPDAMEGPTPVSALIHAATMVAAGVFLVARTYPIFISSVDINGTSLPLAAAAWVGGGTALYAALVAVTQTDIKRILAYSTISQLGFMMVALGTGGVAAAIFHLIVHAFFKALLFLSAGSVIHGCHGVQDIRLMGGLSKSMRRTFDVYLVGMMSLAGFPLVFGGFWSKEAVLHSAQIWPGGKGPFLLAASAALLTAFYMTRQALLVFGGSYRNASGPRAHESPPMMLAPLYPLAAGSVLFALIGSPVWPWFEKWMSGETAEFDPAALAKHGAPGLVGISLVIFTLGIGAAWRFYSKHKAAGIDPLEQKLGGFWTFLHRGMGFDAVYEKLVIGPIAFLAWTINDAERQLSVPLLGLAERVVKLSGGISAAIDEMGLNKGFEDLCSGFRRRTECTSRCQSGQPQSYLRGIGIGMSLLVILYIWLNAS